jgi:hypothetical protein
MAKGPSFNFGANRKPKKSSKGKGGKKKTGGKGKTGNKSNAWRAYVSNAPIPD